VRTDTNDDRGPLTPIALDIRVHGRQVEAIELPGDDDRAAIVLLHEGLGSVGLWRNVPHALQAVTGRRVIAYSRFGHGRSEPPPHQRTPAFFHEEALDVLPSVLEQTGVHRPLLVGHSDGASIALIHAGHEPVAGVVLMAPHVFVEDITVNAISQARDRYLHGNLRDRMQRHHDDVDAAFWGWCDVWLDPAFRAWTLDDDARRLTCPSLLIQGVDDPYGTLAQLDRIEHAAPTSVRRIHVPGGHNPQFDAPEQTIHEIGRFAASVP
jgi:pimeloyl-ACP methyl ester carboxylesterase